MIFGLSGKMYSGKDTVAKMIQFFTRDKKEWKDYTFQDFLEELAVDKYCGEEQSEWQIKKFADKLKDIVCILIGCTREQLEDQEFKNTELGEEWWYYKFENKIVSYLNNLYPDTQHRTLQKYLIKTTPRLLLQLIGTECGRNIIHPDVWVNSLMVDYKVLDDSPIYSGDKMIDQGLIYPNWLVTDIRFPNEVKAIKDREGIIIRIERPGTETSDHYSETALDNYKDWDEVIVNDGTMDDLLEKVKLIVSKYDL